MSTNIVVRDKRISRQAQLAELESEVEKAIDKGRQSYVELGVMLGEIKSARLWDVQYASFEDYLLRRWRWKSDYARKQIAAAEANTIVSAAGAPPELIPPAEYNMRPLVPLILGRGQKHVGADPKAAAKVLETVGANATAEQIKAEVSKYLPPKKRVVKARKAGDVPIAAQKVIAWLKELRTMIRADWKPKLLKAALLGPEHARFVARLLRERAAEIVSLADELERRNPPIGGQK